MTLNLTLSSLMPVTVTNAWSTPAHTMTLAKPALAAAGVVSRHSPRRGHRHSPRQVHRQPAEHQAYAELPGNTDSRCWRCFHTTGCTDSQSHDANPPFSTLQSMLLVRDCHCNPVPRVVGQAPDVPHTAGCLGLRVVGRVCGLAHQVQWASVALRQGQCDLPQGPSPGPVSSAVGHLDQLRSCPRLAPCGRVGADTTPHVRTAEAP
jgi:hypothetical protein